MQRGIDMLQQSVKMCVSDGVTAMRFADVTTSIDIRPAGNNGQEIRHMLTQNIDIDMFEKGRKFRICQKPVIDQFRKPVVRRLPYFTYREGVIPLCPTI